MHNKYKKKSGRPYYFFKVFVLYIPLIKQNLNHISHLSSFEFCLFAQRKNGRANYKNVRKKGGQPAVSSQSTLSTSPSAASSNSSSSLTDSIASSTISSKIPACTTTITLSSMMTKDHFATNTKPSHVVCIL